MSFQANPAPAVLAPNLGYSEITPGFTRRWRNAVKGVRNGAGNARVLLMGHSVLAGAGEGTSGAYNYVGAATRGFHARLPTTELPYRYTSYAGCQTVNAQQSFATYDPRFSLSGGASVFNSTHCLSGDMLTCTSGQSGSAVFTPGTSFDRVEILYLSNTNNSSVVVTAGADSLTTLVGNAALGLHTTGVLNCSALRTAVTLAWQNDGSFGCPIQAILTSDSSKREIQVISAGWAGGKISNLADASLVYASANVIPVLNPDLVLIVGATLNDATAGTAPSAWQSSAQGLIDLIRASGSDVAFTTDMNVEADSSNAVNLTLQQTIRTLCAANNASLLDMHERWRPRASWAPAAANYYDARHPTYAGGSDWAAMIGRFLRLIAEGQAD